MADDIDKALAKRLQAAVREAGGPRSVAIASGVPERSLTRYLSGSSAPSATTLYKIAAVTNVSLDWLAGGLENAISGRSGRPETAIESGGVVAIPLLNVVGSAGDGVENGYVEELARLAFDATLLRRLGVRPEAAHFIIARGDSMEPTIQDGATVLIDSSRNRVRDDGIYAIVVDGDVRLKRVQKKATGSVDLISDNPRYRSESLSGDDVDRLRVAGKVFWSGGGV